MAPQNFINGYSIRHDLRCIAKFTYTSCSGLYTYVFLPPTASMFPVLGSYSRGVGNGERKVRSSRRGGGAEFNRRQNGWENGHSK